MPLVGLVDGGRAVSTLMSSDEWDSLTADLRAKRRVLALPCGFAGHTKRSKLGTPYFAHNPGGDGCSAGETAQHLLAKAIIVQAVIDVGWDAEPESRGDGWIADVMATKDGVRVVFEVQWTRQPLQDYQTRQDRYREAGIASTAWFARHTEDLPEADRALPVFHMAVTEDATVNVTVGDTDLPLAEAVQRLLTKRIQHRQHVADGKPAIALIEGATMDCYRCKKFFGVWNLAEVTVTGNCGQTAHRWRGTDVFATNRPEALPEIKAAGEALTRKMGLDPARIFQRTTQASGATYEAFTCPHCNATCGDMFVQQTFLSENADSKQEVIIPATAVPQAHWCTSETEPCRIPPPAVLEELARLTTVTTEQAASVTIVPVGRTGGMPIHQAVSRMFGGGH